MTLIDSDKVLKNGLFCVYRWPTPTFTFSKSSKLSPILKIPSLPPFLPMSMLGFTCSNSTPKFKSTRTQSMRILGSKSGRTTSLKDCFERLRDGIFNFPMEGRALYGGQWKNRVTRFYSPNLSFCLHCFTCLFYSLKIFIYEIPDFSKINAYKKDIFQSSWIVTWYMCNLQLLFSSNTSNPSHIQNNILLNVEMFFFPFSDIFSQLRAN